MSLKTVLIVLGVGAVAAVVIKMALNGSDSTPVANPNAVSTPDASALPVSVVPTNLARPLDEPMPVAAPKPETAVGPMPPKDLIEIPSPSFARGYLPIDNVVIEPENSKFLRPGTIKSRY
jgi:hypothetical protein